MNFEINNKNILKFVLPCIMTMVFTSIFVMSDGLIVSNFINETALAAINLALPVTSLFLAIGLMFGSGISAICSRLIGQNKKEEARQAMSMILIVSFIIGVVLTILIQLNIESILKFLGTSNDTYDYAYSYLKVLSLGAPILIIQIVFQSLMVVSNNAFKYFKTMIVSGIIKILLGCLLVGYLNLGTTGLAIAVVVGFSIVGLVSFLTLLKVDADNLYLVKPTFKGEIIINTISNGASEMVTNLSTAITTFLFNLSMIKLVGDNGVSAVTIILYIQFLLSSIFMGYSIGIAPIIGYNYGRSHSDNLRKIFKCSLKIISIISVISFLIGITFSNVLSSLFAEVGSEIYILASSGLRIFSICFLFMGINIYASGMFTAYSNGKVSAFISLLRTIVFISCSLLVLPNFFYVTGVFLAIPLAEFMTVFVSLYLFKKYSKKYMYSKDLVMNNDVIKSNNLIITFNRSFGSGGKEIAKRVSDELKVAFYDEDIINDILNEAGITDNYLEKYSDVNFSKNYDFKFATSFSKFNQTSTFDVFDKHSKIIKELVKLGNGIFVGNCANYILRDYEVINVYIYASSEDYIIDRIYEKGSKEKDETSKRLLDVVSKINKSREDYYEYYTGKKITDTTSYDIVLDVSKVGLKECVKLIVEMINNKEEE